MSSAVEVHKARLETLKGRDVNQDNWMVMWYNANWGEVLQLVPLSITLLGSLLAISSGKTDFLLADVSKDFTSMELKNAKSSASFKACLHQVVGEGYTAFNETASKQMTRIQNASSQLPEKIKNAASIILSNTSPQEVEAFLPLELDAILQLTYICVDAAKQAEVAFKGTSDLAQEVLGCATFKAGNVAEQVKINEAHKQALEIQKKQQEEMIKQAKETSELMKKSFTDAEAVFKDAVEKVPSEWGLMAMILVETLTNTLTGGLDEYLGVGNTNNHYLQSGGVGGHVAASPPSRPAQKTSGFGFANIPSALAVTTVDVAETAADTILGGMGAMLGGGNTNRQPPSGRSQAEGQAARSSLPSSPALSDPGLNLAQQVLAIVRGLDLLISSGPDGKPDWTNIRGGGGKSGGLFVEQSLGLINGRLDGTKPVSQELSPIVGKAIRIAKAVNAAASSPNGVVDTALDLHKPVVNNMKAELQGIVTRCNLILQQTGTAGAGSGIPGTPDIPQGIDQNPSLANKAIENDKHSVDQTRANLEAARKSYNEVAGCLIENQRKITATITELTASNFERAQLKEIIPVLTKAVKAFTTHRAQFSQLVQSFSAVASLVDDVIKPQVSSWANKVDQGANLILGGVSLSDFYRNAIYTQMMGPLKVSMLTERISSTYLRVSDQYIMPGQREIGQLLQLQEDMGSGGNAKFLAQLAKSQKIISDRSKTASEGIIAIVGEDQKKFAAQIQLRLEKIVNTVSKALPTVQNPVPAKIQEVIDNHVAEVKRQKLEEMTGTPPYEAELGD